MEHFLDFQERSHLSPNPLRTHPSNPLGRHLFSRGWTSSPASFGPLLARRMRPLPSAYVAFLAGLFLLPPTSFSVRHRPVPSRTQGRNKDSNPICNAQVFPAAHTDIVRVLLPVSEEHYVSAGDDGGAQDRLQGEKRRCQLGGC